MLFDWVRVRVCVCAVCGRRAECFRCGLFGKDVLPPPSPTIHPGTQKFGDNLVVGQFVWLIRKCAAAERRARMPIRVKMMADIWPL